MIHVRQFLDKMAVMEARQNKDVVLPISDARGLRDDIARLLADLHELTTKAGPAPQTDILQVEISGGTFK